MCLSGSSLPGLWTNKRGENNIKKNGANPFPGFLYHVDVGVVSDVAELQFSPFHGRSFIFFLFFFLICAVGL
jgi:hypothetical protein